MGRELKKVFAGIAATLLGSWIVWVSSSLANLNSHVAVLRFQAFGIASLKSQSEPVDPTRSPLLAQPGFPVWLWLPQEDPNARK